MLTEIGATENGGNKAAWLTSFFAGMNDPANRDVIGFVWFNHVITAPVSGQSVTNDWRLNSTSAASAAAAAGFAAGSTRYVAFPGASSGSAPSPLVPIPAASG